MPQGKGHCRVSWCLGGLVVPKFSRIRIRKSWHTGPANNHGITDVCQGLATVRRWTPQPRVARSEMTMGLVLTSIPETLTVCRLAPDADLPAWATAGAFCSITRTSEELSIVVAKDRVPVGVRAEGVWRALKVAGP